MCICLHIYVYLYVYSAPLCGLNSGGVAQLHILYIPSHTQTHTLSLTHTYLHIHLHVFTAGTTQTDVGSTTAQSKFRRGRAGARGHPRGGATPARGCFLRLEVLRRWRRGGQFAVVEFQVPGEGRGHSTSADTSSHGANGAGTPSSRTHLYVT